MGASKTGRRRTQAEVLELVAKANDLVAGGMGFEAAASKVGLAKSIYSKYRKRGTVMKPGAQAGSVDIRMLPPRPKKGKGGFRKPKPVDMNDIGSVAMRISRIDKKLTGIDALYVEREKLGAQLLELLRRKRRV